MHKPPLVIRWKFAGVRSVELANNVQGTNVLNGSILTDATMMNVATWPP